MRRVFTLYTLTLIHTRAHVHVRHTRISVYGYRLLFFIPDRRHRSCSDVAAMLLLLLRINYGNFRTLRTTHVCVCVCVCEVYVGVRSRQSSERKQSFSIPSDKNDTKQRVAAAAAAASQRCACALQRSIDIGSRSAPTLLLLLIAVLFLLPRLSLVTC